MKRRTNIPLGTLRSFEAAARLGRMTLAADELLVTHGAISRQVGQLEAHLGIDLFTGPRNRPALTAAGVTLLGALTPALDQIDAAIRTVGETDPAVVDVACFSTFAMRWLIPRLHRFQRTHPSINIRLSTDERPPQHLRQRFDVEITLVASCDLMLSSDVTLFPESLGVIATRELVQPSASFDVQHLRHLPQLSSRTRAGAWREWAKLAKLDPAAIISRRPTQFEHYTFAIEAAAAGLGTCVVPYHLVADDVASTRLVAPFGFLGNGQVYVARQIQTRNRSARHFTEWLKREAAKLKQPVPNPKRGMLNT
jgi:LysR family transcriptional regulator, glycine cleavage system transcriptional activator